MVTLPLSLSLYIYLSLSLPLSLSLYFSLSLPLSLSLSLSPLHSLSPLYLSISLSLSLSIYLSISLPVSHVWVYGLCCHLLYILLHSVLYQWHPQLCHFIHLPIHRRWASTSPSAFCHAQHNLIQVQFNIFFSLGPTCALGSIRHHIFSTMLIPLSIMQFYIKHTFINRTDRLR